MKSTKYSELLSIIFTSIIGFITIFILSKTIDFNKSATNNFLDTVPNINIINNKNKQIDSIKYLNETIIELKKELDKLKQQQKTDLSKPTEVSP